jgi:signal transduction histidine kinase
MFSSLRSRLWLSYALVIGSNLLIIAMVLILYLIRNPLEYRKAMNHLREVETNLMAVGPALIRSNVETTKARLVEFAQENEVRIIIFDDQKKILVDTGEGLQSAFPTSSLRSFRLNPVVRDVDNNAWLVVIRKITNQRWVEFAVLRPKVELLVILRDEIIPPFAIAGVTAVFLSLLLAFLLSRWIAKPLQRIVVSANDFPIRKNEILPLEGPREVQDLTKAFNKMTDRVETSQKSQRDFVANVSHELKTPLTSIQGFAQALKDGTAATPALKERAADVILNESDRMHQMVLDLLDLAKLDAGTAEIRRIPVNLHEIFSDLLEKFKPLIEKSEVRLIYKPVALPIIQGDPDRLHQVFSNLLDNSIKFTPPGENISIEFTNHFNEIEVILSDSGKGISEKDLPHVFERFYQGDPSRKGGKEHGTGLGLAIALEIIQAHDGKIDVSSKLGEGSTFTVKLPI